jgi:hypothetical protein
MTHWTSRSTAGERLIEQEHDVRRHDGRAGARRPTTTWWASRSTTSEALGEQEHDVRWRTTRVGACPTSRWQRSWASRNTSRNALSVHGWRRAGRAGARSATHWASKSTAGDALGKQDARRPATRWDKLGDQEAWRRLTRWARRKHDSRRRAGCKASS